MTLTVSAVGIVYLIFALVAVPVLFFMFTWTVVTAYRILFPEEPSPYVQDTAYLRRRTPVPAEGVLVGVREIREDQRRSQSRCGHGYCYSYGSSAGLPENWREDIARRRN